MTTSYRYEVTVPRAAALRRALARQTARIRDTELLAADKAEVRETFNKSQVHLLCRILFGLNFYNAVVLNKYISRSFKLFITTSFPQIAKWNETSEAEAEKKIMKRCKETIALEVRILEAPDYYCLVGLIYLAQNRSPSFLI